MRELLHYSDCYTHLKNCQYEISDVCYEQLRDALEQLENNTRNANFFDVIKDKPSTHSLQGQRYAFDKEQLQAVEKGLSHLLNTFFSEQIPSHKPHFLALKSTLQQIHETVKLQQKKTKPKSTYFDTLVNQYATIYFPFNQSYDPFKGNDFKGYCLGHNYQYAKLVADQKLDKLSHVSNAHTPYYAKKINSFWYRLFNNRGWYSSINEEKKIRQVLWETLAKMDEKSIFSFNYFIENIGYHAITLRIVNHGIELFDANKGVLQYKNRSDCVDFLTEHLQELSSKKNISFISVFQLPFKNNPNYSPWQAFAKTIVPKEKKDTIHHPQSVEKHLRTLSLYAKKILSQSKRLTAIVKAHEISDLVERLSCYTTEDIFAEVSHILDKRQHGLLVNRGTGLYFFNSQFGSHSTTEDLLKRLLVSASEWVSYPAAPH